ncbi:hypothetical protein BURK2_04249 [Burkholderiales bacterium]|nr:hypothetical protein BURK2_04249 [Burkholderiales bacterium]
MDFGSSQHLLHPCLARLSGGDRRSVGAAGVVARELLDHPELVAVVFSGLDGEDALLRMRCADALEKASALRPEILRPYRRALLTRYAAMTQKEVRWHVAPMLLRLPLTNREARLVRDRLLDYTQDASSIVKTLAMQGLADLAQRFPQWRVELARHLRELTAIGTPAMKARGKRLLRRFDRPQTPTSRTASESRPRPPGNTGRKEKVMSQIPMVSVENVNLPGSRSRVNAAKYAAMRKVLLRALPPRPPGLTQGEMAAAIAPLLPQDIWPGGDKALWWMKAVQLDLEAKGVVMRDRKSKPMRWWLA